MTSFSETRLELGLTYGASYGPRFSTAINAQANGVEIADAEWEDPLIQINLPDKAYTRSETEYLLDFHATMKGSLTGFRIRDWSDYFVTGQAIGTGNGTVQEWQLIKTYTVGSYSVKRAITKPVAGSLVVYVNGVQTNSGWSVDTTTGKFTTELTGAITVDFEFDVPVRFVEDKLDFRFDAVQGTNALFTQQPITLTEIRVTPWAYPSLDPFPVSLAHQIDLGYDLGTTGGPEFDTFIAETASEWESRVARRDSPLGAWNLGDRTLTRSQVNYLIALFRIARGRAIPFGYLDYQEETVKLIRFTEDRLGVSFLAHRHSDKQAIFSLAAIGIKSVALMVCTPKTVTFSDPLSSTWSIYDARNTGYWAGASYSVDTSGGFWRTTLNYGNGVDSYAAYIEWGNGWSYTPLFSNEVIELVLSADLRWVSDIIVPFSPLNDYPLTLIARQGNKTVSTTIKMDQIGWKRYSHSSNFGTFIVGVPIIFTIAKSSGSGVQDPTPNTIIYDARLLNVDVNVTCQ